jgi:hypothetical protein
MALLTKAIKDKQKDDLKEMNMDGTGHVTEENIDFPGMSDEEIEMVLKNYGMSDEEIEMVLNNPGTLDEEVKMELKHREMILDGKRMDENKFWKIFEAVKEETDGSEETFGYSFHGWMTPLTTKDFSDFIDYLYLFRKHARSTDLWKAANIIIDGCSDDDFNNFLSWFLFMGRAAYEKALDDPDSLVDFVYKGYKRKFYELDLIVEQVYEENTGEKISLGKMKVVGKDDSEKKSDNVDVTDVDSLSNSELKDSELQSKFPKLWAKFKEEPEPSEVTKYVSLAVDEYEKEHPGRIYMYAGFGVLDEFGDVKDWEEYSCGDIDASIMSMEKMQFNLAQKKEAITDNK